MQKNQTGLIIGKFYPFHKGHEYLIRESRKQAEKLTVLVCSLSSETIEGSLRHKWLSEIFPDVNVIHVTDENPQYPHEHPDFWEIWVQTITKRIPEIPDIIFSSEEYGYELAKRLGSTHVPIDIDRNKFPVSGTKIRNNPHRYWDYIPMNVRPYFVKKIVITGPESTGKSITTHLLADYFHTEFVDEYAREFLDKKGKYVDIDDIPSIAQGHLLDIEKKLLTANKFLFIDTDIIVTKIYSNHYFGFCPQWILEKAKSIKYDYYLLMNIDIPWIADPLRDSPHLRKEFFEIWKNELDSYRLPFTIIDGAFEERTFKAISFIENYFNY